MLSAVAASATATLRLGAVFAWGIVLATGEHRAASRVAPIDKVSLAFTIVMAWVLLGEHVTWRVALGTALMVAGALVTLSE